MACQQKPFKKKTAKKVSFHENTEIKDFSTYNSPCDVKKSTAYAKTLNDNSNRTFYTNITRKTPEISQNDGIYFSQNKKTIQLTTTKANCAAPAPPQAEIFFIRGTGHIMNIEDDTYSNGCKFIYSELSSLMEHFEEGSGIDMHDISITEPEKSSTNSQELAPNDDVGVVQSEGESQQQSFSHRQTHDAHKIKSPKKKALRGGKKKSQNIKADASNPLIFSAMQAEIKKFQDYGVYEIIDDDPKIYKVPSQWVLTCKDSKKEGEEVYKARLVALGNLDRKINLRATDSPTVSRESLRMILATIANMEWQLKSTDVSSAFLQGCDLNRTVFMRPPKEFSIPGKTWLLKKPVYGLADSSRLWWQKLQGKLLELGACEMTGDKAFFYYHSEGKLQGVIAVHVDDLLYAGTEKFEEKIMSPLMDFFNISKTDEDSFVFCGMKISQSSDKSITVSQLDYASNIEEIPDYTHMTDPEKLTLLKSIAGQIMYLSLTRPDLVFEASDLLRSGRTNDERLLLAKQLMKKVKDGKGEIKFKKLGNPENFELIVHSDASYNNIKSNKVSTGGYVVILKGGNGNCAPISWSSKPIVRVTRSTMAAEARALENAADHSVLYSRQLRELYTGKRTKVGITVSCFTDSNVLHDAIVSTRQIEEKALVHLIYGLKDKLKWGEIKRISWVSTKKMLADGLTKKGIDMNGLMNMISEGKFPKYIYFGKKKKSKRRNKNR